MKAWRVLAAAGSIGVVILAASGVVRAQKAVLGPVVAEAADESVHRLAAEALSDALRMQGFHVIGFEEAKRALPHGESCDEACPARLLSALAAELSAVVEIRAVGQGGKPAANAKVKLEDSAGHHYDGSAAIRDGDVRDATTRALLEARSYQLLGPGPWLRVEGTPEGAEVLIDGRVAGKLPYRTSIEAGKHRVVVREAGYGRFEQAIQVAAEDGAKLKLQVALEPAPIEAPAGALALQPAADQEVDTERNHAWLALPIASAALGVGLATVVSVRLASGVERCVEPDAMGRCTERRGVHVWPTAGGYALSAALIATGIVWIVLGTRDESPALAANVGIDHVSLAGSF